MTHSEEMRPAALLNLLYSGHHLAVMWFPMIISLLPMFGTFQEVCLIITTEKWEKPIFMHSVSEWIDQVIFAFIDLVSVAIIAFLQ